MVLEKNVLVRRMSILVRRQIEPCCPDETKYLKTTNVALRKIKFHKQVTPSPLQPLIMGSAFF